MLIMSKIYAVKNGHKIGIFDSWDECQKLVNGFPKADFKSFPSSQREQAEQYLNGQTTTFDSEQTLDIDHNDGQYHVYVDGSFVDGEYAWGLVVYHNGEEIHTDYGIGDVEDMKSMRNVAGEITSAQKAIEWSIANNVNIVLYYDYYGIDAWPKGAWSANNIHTMNYANFMIQHENRYRSVHTKGHTDILGNERADDLARKALGI